MSVISQSHSQREDHRDERRTERAEKAAEKEYERTIKAAEEHRKALEELETKDEVETRVTSSDEDGKVSTKVEKREMRRSARAEGKPLDSLLRPTE